MRTPPERGPLAAILPPMPLSLEEALGDYIQVKPDPSPRVARVVPKKRKAAKPKARKKGKAAKKAMREERLALKGR